MNTEDTYEIIRYSSTLKVHRLGHHRTHPYVYMITKNGNRISIHQTLEIAQQEIIQLSK